MGLERQEEGKASAKSLMALLMVRYADSTDKAEAQPERSCQAGEANRYTPGRCTRPSHPSHSPQHRSRTQ